MWYIYFYRSSLRTFTKYRIAVRSLLITHWPQFTDYLLSSSRQDGEYNSVATCIPQADTQKATSLHWLIASREKLEVLLQSARWAMSIISAPLPPWQVPVRHGHAWGRKKNLKEKKKPNNSTKKSKNKVIHTLELPIKRPKPCMSNQASFKPTFSKIPNKSNNNKKTIHTVQ